MFSGSRSDFTLTDVIYSSGCFLFTLSRLVGRVLNISSCVCTLTHTRTHARIYTHTQNTYNIITLYICYLFFVSFFLYIVFCVEIRFDPLRVCDTVRSIWFFFGCILGFIWGQWGDIFEKQRKKGSVREKKEIIRFCDFLKKKREDNCMMTAKLYLLQTFFPLDNIYKVITYINGEMRGERLRATRRR